MEVAQLVPVQQAVHPRCQHDLVDLFLVFPKDELRSGLDVNGVEADIAFLPVADAHFVLHVLDGFFEHELQDHSLATLLFRLLVERDEGELMLGCELVRVLASLDEPHRLFILLNRFIASFSGLFFLCCRNRCANGGG